MRVKILTGIEPYRIRTHENRVVFKKCLKLPHDTLFPVSARKILFWNCDPLFLHTIADSYLLFRAKEIYLLNQPFYLELIPKWKHTKTSFFMNADIRESMIDYGDKFPLKVLNNSAFNKILIEEFEIDKNSY